MAMIDCPKCGGLYSDKVGKCRHCGYVYEEKHIDIDCEKYERQRKKFKETQEMLEHPYEYFFQKNLDWRNLVLPIGFY